jgi:hypothetical protein
MKLRRTYDGYICVADRWLQFQRRVSMWDERGHHYHGWEVRLGGRRRSHLFRTLREAKDWARQWIIRRVLSEQMGGVMGALVRLVRHGLVRKEVAGAMLRAALAGDQLAHGQLFDLVEDQTGDRWPMCELGTRLFLESIGVFPARRRRVPVSA